MAEPWTRVAIAGAAAALGGALLMWCHRRRAAGIVRAQRGGRLNVLCLHGLAGNGAMLSNLPGMKDIEAKCSV